MHKENKKATDDRASRRRRVQQHLRARRDAVDAAEAERAGGVGDAVDENPVEHISSLSIVL